MNEPESPFSPAEETDAPAVAQDPTHHGWVRPEATEGSLVNVAPADDGAGDWTPVGKTAAPSPPPMPLAVKIGGGVLIALLLAGASWLGLNLGSSEPTPEPTPTPTVPAWPLEPPTVYEDWVRGEMSVTEPAEGAERTVVTSTYSTGMDRIALILSRPETDLTQFLEDAAINSMQPIEDSTCGLSEDTGVPVCIQIIDETAILVAGTDGQSFDELDALVEEFYELLAGRPKPSPTPEATAEEEN